MRINILLTYNNQYKFYMYTVILPIKSGKNERRGKREGDISITQKQKIINTKNTNRIENKSEENETKRDTFASSPQSDAERAQQA